MSTKTKKTLAIILLAVGILLTVYGIFSIVKKPKQTKDQPGADSPDEAEEPEPPKNIVEGLIDKVTNNSKYPNPSGKNRGLKNHNPGNIRLTTQAWKGKRPSKDNTDGQFEQFTAKFWGVRAMIRIVKGWIEKGKVSTLEDVINKYSPPSENNSNHIIATIAEKYGFNRNAILTADKETLRKIILGIGMMETGKGSITMADFDKAWQNLA